MTQKIKDKVTRAEKKGKGYTFLLLVDGSQRSYNGLDVVANYKKDGDSIVALYFFEHPNHLKQIEETIGAKAAHLKTAVKFLGVKVGPTADVSEELLKFVNESDEYNVDWLVLGSNGLNKEKHSSDSIGSTASNIMQKCLVNIIVV